jgi:hypothetical protein
MYRSNVSFLRSRGRRLRAHSHEWSLTNGSDLILKLGSDLVAKLKEPLTPDRWELSVYREKETPGVKMFHVLMHVDEPK